MRIVEAAAHAMPSVAASACTGARKAKATTSGASMIATVVTRPTVLPVQASMVLYGFRPAEPGAGT